MSAGRLQARLSSSAKASWASRSVKESVVLMDWNSKDLQSANGSAIATLLDILKNVCEIHIYYNLLIILLSRCSGILMSPIVRLYKYWKGATNTSS